MPFPIEEKLVIAVSSSAVFDMIAADRIFREDGEDAYRKFQNDNLDVPFEKGIAFPFIKRILRLNEVYPDVLPIEVIVLSRNDPDSGQLFFRSCKSHGLTITRGAFLDGKDHYPYISAFNAALFLSAIESDVRSSVEARMPAGLVLPTEATDDEADMELRVAFDFDGVVADDEAETVYQESKDLGLFHQSETDKAQVPHNPGPLSDLIRKMAVFQKWEKKRAKTSPDFKPALRIAIVTARDAPANERMVTTLSEWGLEAVEAFFLGGVEKRRVLEVLKPHIFFEDQLTHLATAAAAVPSVHIPFGITNRPRSEEK